MKQNTSHEIMTRHVLRERHSKLANCLLHDSEIFRNVDLFVEKETIMSLDTLQSSLMAKVAKASLED